AFVVRRPTRIHAPRSDARLERRRFPKGERFRRLNIVMPVDQVVRAAVPVAGAGRVREHHRIAIRWTELGLQSDLPAVFGEPFGARQQIGLVLRLSGNTRKAQVSAEFVDETAFVLFEVLEDGLHARVLARVAWPSQAGTRLPDAECRMPPLVAWTSKTQGAWLKEGFSLR